MALKQTNKNRKPQPLQINQSIVKTSKQVKTPVATTYLNTRPLKQRRFPVSLTMLVIIILLLIVISFL